MRGEDKKKKKSEPEKEEEKRCSAPHNNDKNVLHIVVTLFVIRAHVI